MHHAAVWLGNCFFMNGHVTVTQKQLLDVLLHVATVRPVHIWGQPGIGKTQLVEEFGRAVGMPVVSLLGSQLAPEDLIGVPMVQDGKSRFFPPALIARDEPYILFLDELNGASVEVARAMYSVILEKRIGDYRMPEGSVVIAAGNRAQDNAIVRPLPSALINRMTHVHLRVSHRDWLEWAARAGIHPWVINYIQARPNHLVSPAPKKEEPFSTPRSWHYVSDELHSYGEDVTDEQLSVIAYGNLTPSHAGEFRAFVRTIRYQHDIGKILKGEASWPREENQRDVLYFLANSFRSQLLKELPPESPQGGSARQFAHRAKALIRELAEISFEVAQLVVASQDEQDSLPDWFLTEIVRDLPRLAVAQRHANG